MWGDTTLVMSVVCYDNFSKWSLFSSRGQFLSKGAVADDLPALLQARWRRRTFCDNIFADITDGTSGPASCKQVGFEPNIPTWFTHHHPLSQATRLFKDIPVHTNNAVVLEWVFWLSFGMKLKIPNVCPIAQNQYWFLFKVWFPSRTHVVS